MFPYTYTDPVLAEIIRAVTDGVVQRYILDDGPARIAEFWATDAVVSTGLSWAHTAAALVSAICVFVIVISIFGRRALKQQPEASASPDDAPTTVGATGGGVLRERFTEVTRHLDSPRESDWKIAVIEADKLMDDALRRAGYGGDSFGDRLTGIAPGTLVSLDGIWWAHKVRNRLAHEVDYFLRYTEAKQAVAYYRQALEELQML